MRIVLLIGSYSCITCSLGHPRDPGPTCKQFYDIKSLIAEWRFRIQPICQEDDGHKCLGWLGVEGVLLAPIEKSMPP